MEPFELVELLAGGRVKDRLVGDRLDRERRSAACVAVELRHQDAVELNPVGELLRDVHRVLARHRVQHKQHVVRVRSLTDRDELAHQLLVDVQAPRCVDDHDVLAGRLRLAERPFRDLDGIAVGPLLVDLRASPLANRHELLDGRRPLRVARDQRRLLPLFGQQLRQLCAGRRLSRALKARHQDHRRPRAGEREVTASSAHEGRELLVHDLHDLLARIEAFEHPLADTALTHLRGELLDDLEVDIGLEQREPDLAHRAVDVGLAQLAARANAGECLLQTIRKLVEHVC